MVQQTYEFARSELKRTVRGVADALILGREADSDSLVGASIAFQQWLNIFIPAAIVMNT